MRIQFLSIVCIALFFTFARGQATHEEQLIFPMQEKHVHGSSIIELPGGDLLACWFYGSGERRAKDVRIQGSRLRRGEKVWSEIFLMADTPNLPDCNPVLFLDQKQRLWMFWIVVQAERWERSILKYRRSVDYNSAGAPKWEWQDVILFQPGEPFADAMQQASRNLSAHEPMWSEYAQPYGKMLVEAAQDPVKRQAGWMTRIHPLVLPTGRILLPLYSDGYNVSIAGISDDQGDTWQISLPIIGLGPIQPSFVRKNDGAVVAYMRDSGTLPQRVLKSVSEDNGETWTFAEDTDIPNPGSSLEVIKLKEGPWLMVYNDTEDGRHSLAVSLSDDEGQNWYLKRHIEKVAQGKGSFAYPSIFQAADGTIHLTYSHELNRKKAIKHVQFNLEWIKEQ